MENVLHARLYCAFDMYLSFMHGYVCLLLDLVCIDTLYMQLTGMS